MDGLLKLSIATQFALGSGYIAYCLAYLGNRSHHQTIDVTLSTLGFGLIATAILMPSPFSGRYLNHPWVEILAFAVTALCGLAWRSFGRKALTWVLRRFDISWKDDAPTTLDTVHQDTEFYTTQIAVLIDDGTWLRCDNTSIYKDAPFGPCIIGQDGSVGMYLTSEDKPDGSSKEATTVYSNDWGYRLTYIPAAKIQRITLRHSPKSQRDSIISRWRRLALGSGRRSHGAGVGTR